MPVASSAIGMRRTLSRWRVDLTGIFADISAPVTVHTQPRCLTASANSKNITQSHILTLTAFETVMHCFVVKPWEKVLVSLGFEVVASIPWFA